MKTNNRQLNISVVPVETMSYSFIQNSVVKVLRDSLFPNRKI